ncbi:MAG: hypothetical protein ABL986_01530 [Vicinamibacterales bacterium]
MTRWFIAAIAGVVLFPAVVRGQAAVVEVQQNAGMTSESNSVASTQLRVFGEPVAGLRFKLEGSFGQQFGEGSDFLGTAYPYGGRADLIEAYAEYLFTDRFLVRSVRAGRYRTPFGISSAGEHGYIGFTRPPLIRYGEYWALSSGYMEHGIDVVVGRPQLSAELSVGRPGDVGDAIRRPGVDTVVRVEGSSDSLVVGASFIDTTPYLPIVWAHGRARYGGVDARWMKGGVALRGEWLAGRPFNGVSTVGGYVDAIVHRPVMGPVTLVARAERLDYDTPMAEFVLKTHRAQLGARVRLWQGLSVSAGVSHQGGQQTQHKPTVMDVSLSYALRTRF